MYNFNFGAKQNYGLCMSQEPDLHQLSQTQLLRISCRCDFIFHSFVHNPCQLARLLWLLQMRLIVSFPPDYIYCSLKDQPHQQIFKTPISMGSKEIKSAFPIRIRRSPQQGTNNFKPQGVCVGTQQKTSDLLFHQALHKGDILAIDPKLMYVRRWKAYSLSPTRL